MQIFDLLTDLQSRGLVFDTLSLAALAQLDEGAQVAALQHVWNYIQNPSALLMHLVKQHRETGLFGVQAICALEGCAASLGEGAVRDQVLDPCFAHEFFQDDRPSLPHETDAHAEPALRSLQVQKCKQNNKENCAPMVNPSSSKQDGSASCPKAPIPAIPQSQNLMCQPEFGVAGCSQTVSSCTSGALEPCAVEHALTLVGSDLAYLTVCGARGIESFPWKLPAGWYALHVVHGGLEEQPLLRKVVGAGIDIPSDLPTNCVVAVIKLGTPQPRQSFVPNPWALGQWCQIVEDVLPLHDCVPIGSQELRRLWVLPEEVRAQIRACVPVGLPEKEGKQDVVSCDAETVDPHGGNPFGESLASAPRCKKARVSNGPPFPHASFPQHPPAHIDRLQKLYPHPRDSNIHMDEKLHKYIVCGQQYRLSVSGWWAKFFGDFDAKTISEGIVRRQMETPGFRIGVTGENTDGALVSSVYNFAQRIRILERRSDAEYLDALRSVALLANTDYASRGACCPYSTERIMEQGMLSLIDTRKPDAPSCYYLVLLYTAALGPEAQAAEIAGTWELNGKLESLKGTCLHKKIELFINAMVRPMERYGKLFVPAIELLKEQPPAHEYSAETVMRHIAWAQEPELWDHPVAQQFFESEVEGESLEFSKFRSWLSTKPYWSPFRVEWSVYNEDLKVAGQIDSLWIDLGNGRNFVMADWKRARELLTNDVHELERQSFGRKGLSHCSHLYDTAWSHYFVQQTLYAYLLATKYSILVNDMKLVQCHPHVAGLDFNEAPLVADFQLAEALAKWLQSGV